MHILPQHQPLPFCMLHIHIHTYTCIHTLNLIHYHQSRVPMEDRPFKIQPRAVLLMPSQNYKNTCFVPCSHHLCSTQIQGTGERSFAVKLILRVERHSKGQTTEHKQHSFSMRWQEMPLGWLTAMILTLLVTWDLSLLNLLAGERPKCPGSLGRGSA